MWYNNNMKNKNIKLLKISNLFLALVFVIGALFGALALFNVYDNNEKVFAANEIIDEESEITRDGTISNELWDALRNFYDENKTGEMPSYKDEENTPYLKINMFQNFPVNVLNLSGKNITNIRKLSFFDLSAFVEINLSNNSLITIGDELKEFDLIEVLNLSKNDLSKFSYTDLSNECITNNLTVLDISENEITECNLSQINMAEIFASKNEITLEKLTLPQNTNLVVWLTDNYIINPDTTNPNLHFGFQGVKNDNNYKIGTKVEFYGLDGLDEIVLYKLTKNGETYDETEIKALGIGESHEFGVGYYKISFNGVRDEIKFHILLNAPTFKMFQNGNEIEYNHQPSSPVTIKFYGEPNAEFGYITTDSNNVRTFNKLKDGEIEISQEGFYNIRVCQRIIDGEEEIYSFDTETISVEYRKSKTMSWVYFILAAAGFIVVGYLIMKFLPQISSIKIGKRSDDNKNDKLD